MEELLQRGLAALAADPSHPAPELLEGRVVAGLLAYIAEIDRFNPALSLVGSKTREELILKHILDSLAPLGALRALLPPGTPRIADAGSGAGLPGIPLAVALPGADFTLIERMGRRVGFLSHATAVLGLGNVSVEESEVVKARPGLYDAVTFRAFRPLDRPMVKALFRLLAPGGFLAAYKAREEKVEAEMEAIEALVGSWEAIETPVPFLDEPRRLVVVRPPRSLSDL